MIIDFNGIYKIYIKFVRIIDKIHEKDIEFQFEHFYSQFCFWNPMRSIIVFKFFKIN